MKKIAYIIVLGLVALAACINPKNTNESDKTRVLMLDSVDMHGVVRMQISDVEQVVTLKGKEYRSQLHRVPNDSLPRVKNDAGTIFVDNAITLSITRSNESLFKKTFTKQTFSSLIGADFMKNAILEGMVFDKTSAAGLVYAASVSYPQTDLYIPILVTIAPDGKMTIEKDELMQEEYP